MDYAEIGARLVFIAHGLEELDQLVQQGRSNMARMHLVVVQECVNRLLQDVSREAGDQPTAGQAQPRLEDPDRDEPVDEHDEPPEGDDPDRGE